MHRSFKARDPVPKDVKEKKERDYIRAKVKELVERKLLAPEAAAAISAALTADANSLFAVFVADQKSPATVTHGDANTGNFLYDEKKDATTIIDVSTMGLSITSGSLLTRNRVGLKSGYADVGRFLESVESAQPGHLTQPELADMRHAFEEVYFAESFPDAQGKSSNKQQTAAREQASARERAQVPILIYRLWLELMALRAASAPPEQKAARDRIGPLLEQAGVHVAAAQKAAALAADAKSKAKGDKASSVRQGAGDKKEKPKDKADPKPKDKADPKPDPKPKDGDEH
jgi:hypothetical protein